MTCFYFSGNRSFINSVFPNKPYSTGLRTVLKCKNPKESPTFHKKKKAARIKMKTLCLELYQAGGMQEMPKFLVIKIHTPTEVKLPLQETPVKKISEFRYKV